MASSAPAQVAKKALNPSLNPMTVHFWAPVLKWGVVIAGIGDFYRPADQLSVAQTLALTATGTIWTRWCLIIKPKNYPLAAVNFFLGGVGLVQLSRIWMHNNEMKKKSKILSEIPVPATKS